MLRRRISPKSRALLTALALTLTLASNVWAGATYAGPTYKVLYGFTGGSDGGGLWSSVVLDRKGKLYGSTSGGGAYGLGVVFRLELRPGGQWVAKVLHNFTDEPQGGVTLGPGHNLYGTTLYGGDHHGGSVFELSPSPEGWIETTLYSFGDNPDDAGVPYARPIMDTAGNFYGTAPLGGGNGEGGTVYMLTLGPEGWVETVLYSFCSQPNCVDGDGAYAGLVLDQKGNIYGTTEYGGIYPPQCPVGSGCGVVYKLRHMPDGTWNQRMLHTFASFPDDGVKPGVGALVFDGSGNLYGTTNQGGKNICDTTHCGTIFRLTRQPNGHWKETIPYNFKKGSSGNGPGAGVVIDSAGNLYGTTIYGGTQCDCGVVYKLAPNPDGTWTYTVLHQFTGFDGAQPDANLILDGQGNLYGTTSTGGPGGAGVVFQITP